MVCSEENANNIGDIIENIHNRSKFKSNKDWMSETWYNQVAYSSKMLAKYGFTSQDGASDDH